MLTITRSQRMAIITMQLVDLNACVQHSRVTIIRAFFVVKIFLFCTKQLLFFKYAKVVIYYVQ